MIRYTMKGEQSHQEFVAQHENGPNFGKNADVYQSDGLLAAERAKMSKTEMGEAMRDASSVEEAVKRLGKRPYLDDAVRRPSRKYVA